MRREQTPRRGYALVAVLVVIVVLSLAAYQFADLMGAERRAAARLGTLAQARASAVSGVHYAAAMLADPNSVANDLAGDPTADGAFQEQTVKGTEGGGRDGKFSLVAVVSDGNGGYSTRYGAVIDEAGRLNINALILQDKSGQALYEALMKLPDMTEDVADAIVDWVDPDADPRTNGAESDYYSGLAEPYKAKNGPLNSLDELLLVRGVTPQLLFGTDRNRNGQADDDPNSAAAFGRGWADHLTVYGRELNLDTAGTLRVNANESEDLPGLHAKLVTAVGQELADMVLAYKMFTTAAAVQTINVTSSITLADTGTSGGGGASGGGGGGGASVGGGSGTAPAAKSNGSTATVTMNVQLNMTVSGTEGGAAAGSGAKTVAGTMADLSDAVKTALAAEPKNKQRLKSVLDLRNVRFTLPRAETAPADAPSVTVDSPLNGDDRLAELLPKLLDKVTTTTKVELPPRLNVNAAAREVLLAVPNLAEADVDSILSKRDAQPPADVATRTAAWLVTSGAVTADTFKKLEPYVTGRSMVYRVQALGYSTGGGPVARAEAVIDTNQGAPRVLYFRDLTDLDSPRGFEPPQ